LEDALSPPCCPIFHLEGFADVPVLQPGLSFYLDLMRRRKGFAFVKRTHGFWDGLVFLSESVPAVGDRVARGESVASSEVRLALSDAGVVDELEERSGYVNHFRDQFYTELIEDLQAPLGLPAYIEANAFRGYPNSDAFPALHPVAKLREVYRSFQISGRTAHDALVWKQAILDGTLTQVGETLREMPVVLVGPPHLSTLAHHLELRHFQHIVIPAVGAPAERYSLLGRCSQSLRDVSDRVPAAVLYQAGALAYWLIYRLFPIAPHTIHLDLGRCLDIWYPDVVGRQPWFVQNRERIIPNMRLEHLHG
jgi:hypothetical protein